MKEIAFLTKLFFSTFTDHFPSIKRIARYVKNKPNNNFASAVYKI